MFHISREVLSKCVFSQIFCSVPLKHVSLLQKYNSPHFPTFWLERNSSLKFFFKTLVTSCSLCPPWTLIWIDFQPESKNVNNTRKKFFIDALFFVLVCNVVILISAKFQFIILLGLGAVSHFATSLPFLRCCKCATNAIFGDTFAIFKDLRNFTNRCWNSRVLSSACLVK